MPTTNVFEPTPPDTYESEGIIVGTYTVTEVTIAEMNCVQVDPTLFNDLIGVIVGNNPNTDRIIYEDLEADPLVPKWLRFDDKFVRGNKSDGPTSPFITSIYMDIAAGLY